MRPPDREKPLSDELGRDSDKGSNSLDELFDRLGRHTKAKLRLQEMVTYLESISHDDRLARKLRMYIKDCSSYLAFNHYYRLDTYKLAGANFCKRHLVCPSCAMRRSAKTLRSVSERFSTLLSDNPDLTPYMMTLTVKNGSDLLERFTHLTDSISRLVKRRRVEISRKNVRSQFSKVSGAFGSYELTYSESTFWHPHYHAVVLLPAGEKIDPFLLSQEWQKVTGDSFIVDVRPLTKADDGTYTKALLEVTKYALKFSSLTVEQNYEAFRTLKGKRMFRTFGCFHGVQVPDDYVDHDAHLADEPFIRMIYSWLYEQEYKLTLIEEGNPDESNYNKIGN